MPVNVTERIVSFAPNPSKNRFAFAGVRGTLWMFDSDQSSLRMTEELDHSPVSLLRWHPQGAVLAVGGVDLHFFDVGLNRIPFQWEHEMQQPLKGTLALKTLGFESNVRDGLWLSAETTSSSDSQPVEFFVCSLIR